jgi:hypothetical protein
MQWHVVALVAVLAGPSWIAAAAAKRYAQMSEAERTASLTQARAASTLAEQLERISAPFVGTVYAHSPLGEGSGVDADPRLRWDKVDCLTFVETTIALCAAPKLPELVPVLDDVRYAVTPPAFNHRNHFVEAQWVPNNLSKGYLRGISREVAGDAAQTLSMQLSPAIWRTSKHPDGLALEAKDVPSGTFSLDFVPLAFARKFSDRIPTGTLLMVVRRDQPKVVTRVTHVGFVLEINGRRVLRHASLAPYGRVVDEPLDKFFARNARYDKRPVDGFALFEIQVPSARLAKLVAGSIP